MQPEKRLVSTEKSSNLKHYALIIGILVLAFSLSLIIRIQPADYGFELAEFDPFFNYRATQFMIENGLPAYLEWNDDLSWHPYGRDVSTTSQVMLHATSATFYKIFGMGMSLYDFTIWFPAIISSLTAIVIFAVVRTISSTTAGLFASLFFAVSPILIMRGSIGWFKSEPLGIFYGLLAIYLLLSGIKSGNGKVSVAKIVGGGVVLALGLSSWGGIQFFILPIGILFLALPFLRKDNKFIVLTSVIFTAVFLLVTILFERTGLAFISSLSGFFLVGCTIFVIACIAVKKITKLQLRYTLGLLGGAIIAGITVISSGMISLPAFRYLNAANPFLITTDMLTDSVSEHASTTIDISFYFFSILMVFAGIGAWFIFQKKVNYSFKIKHEMAAFALIIGFLGAYFSSAFVRLEVFGSISVIILSSIGISILVSKILQQKNKSTGIVTKISFLAVIVMLLMVPMVYPERANWSNHNSGIPISILHSGSAFDISTNDWPDAMKWLRENTPKDAVVAAWWDYGYWISTLGERKTLADNSTLLDWQIKKIALTFFSTPDNAWKILTSDVKTYVGDNFVTFPQSYVTIDGDARIYADSSATNLLERQLEHYSVWRDVDSDDDGIINAEDGDDWYHKEANECDEGQLRISCPKFVVDPGSRDQYTTPFDYWATEVYVPEPILTGLDADYILVNVVGEKLSAENIMELYTMRQKGGDETKAFWFIKIAGLKVLDYYEPGIQGYTDEFWNNTLLGKLIPFTPVLYVDPNNPEVQSETFERGYVVIYVQDNKFPLDEDGPFQLVYASPSFEKNEPGPLTGAFIYKINKDYNPNQ